jgi:DNA internalization-related competence protein ComEC/Rec2
MDAPGEAAPAGGWVIPAAAGAFWAGLIACRLLPEPAGSIPTAVWLGAGGLLLAIGVITASSVRRRDPVAGLAVPEPVTVAAVGSRPLTTARVTLVPAATLVLGLLLLGSGWGALAQARREASLFARLAPARVTVTGTLREDPRPGAYGWHALLAAREVTWRDGAAGLSEALWIDGEEPPGGVVRGDLISVTGTLQVPEEPGFRDALAGKGSSTVLRIDSIERLGPAPNPFVRATQATRRIVGGAIERVLPPREAGLLLGLALGDDSGLDPATERDFQATGLTHLLVVSGGNVAVLIIPVLLLAKALRLARVGTALLGITGVAFIVVLTGAEPSVLRAGTMATVAFIGVLLARPRATGVVLSAAVLVLLVLDPGLATSVGFQLSAAATAGLVALASPLGDRLGTVMPRPLALAAGTTLAAQLGVTPVLLFHFGDVPLVTLIANVAAAPAVAPALGLGLVAAGAALVWEPLGALLGLAAQVPMRYLETIANVLGKAPVAHITSRGGPMVLFVGAALVVALAVALRRGWRPPRAATVTAVAVMPLLVWSTALRLGTPDSLTAAFLDVGQGDAALITSPGGASILIDGGPDAEQVATELAARGVKRLDVLVASHPHADHIVGLPAVLARIPTSLVLQPGCPDDSSIQADLDDAIGDEQIPIRNPRAGDSLSVADVRIDVLSPDRCWESTESDANNDAFVLRVSIGNDVILVASECEEPAQGWLVESGAMLEADVLKVPHHGAGTSLPEFFHAVHAPVAVVSVGENDYGHPVPDTLDHLAHAGSTVFRTDERGTIEVTFREGVPVVTTER